MGKLGTEKPGRYARKRVLLREEIRESLMHDILHGNLRPGGRILESRIAEEYGVSSGPVREALLELETLGYVETSAFRGCYVRRVSDQEWSELYPVRIILESAAARAAATRLDFAGLARLEDQVSFMRVGAAQNDKHAQIEADIAFHQTIVEAAGNRLLVHLWRAMRLVTTIYLNVSFGRLSPAQLAERHVPVLDALRSRDPDAAETAMRSHLGEVSEYPLDEKPSQQ